jgi:hypothetical protein
MVKWNRRPFLLPPENDQDLFKYLISLRDYCRERRALDNREEMRVEDDREEQERITRLKEKQRLFYQHLDRDTASHHRHHPNDLYHHRKTIFHGR